MKKLNSFFFAFLFISGFVTAQTTYVNHAAIGLNNGTSWADAYTDLNTAIANTISGQIWVATGTYRPGISGNNAATFPLKASIAIFGGFQGTETLLGQQNPSLYPTVLSGDLDASGSLNPNDAYHVVTTGNVSAGSLLDGFTITGGNAAGGSMDTQCGGGVFCAQSSPGGLRDPSIRNCLIQNNYAATGGGGVAVFTQNLPTTNSPYFSNCRIIHNSSSNYAGGIYSYAEGSGSFSNGHFENCLLHDNFGIAGGTHLYIKNMSGGENNTFVINCTFGDDTPGTDIEYFANGVLSGYITFHNSIFYGLQVTTDYTMQGSNNCGNTSQITGGGNFNLDPLFINPATDNYSLLCTSPCINSGANAQATYPEALNGITRIQEGVVDRGAYESIYGLPLTVNANASTPNVCLGSTVILFGSGTVGLNYTWSHGAFNNVPYTPLATDTYTVTGTDGNGCVGTGTVIVATHQPATVLAGLDVDVCADAASGIALNGSATNAAGVQWQSTGVGLFTPDQVSLSVQYSPSPAEISAGLATLSLEATPSTAFCPSVTDTVKIFIHALPVVGLGTDITICETDSIYLNTTVTSGTPPFLYNWQNSVPVTISTSNSEYYTPAGTDTYSLFVSDTYGCSGSDSYLVTVDPSNAISGVINAGAGVLTDGTIYLIKYLPIDQIFDTLITYPLTASGTYLFPGVPFGHYLIKVIPDPTLFPNLLPTYFGDEFQWDSAVVITHNCAVDFTADVNMIALLPGTGSGTIEGDIVEDFGYGSRQGSGYHQVMVPGGPLKGIDVKLGKNPAGGIQARTMSDSLGHYVFNDLPDDSYRIYVDIPGLPMDSFYVVNISAANNSYVELDYFVDSNSVYPILETNVGLKPYAAVASELSVFPNPAKDYTSIRFVSEEESTATIQLSDITGKQLINIRLQHLPKGNHEYQLNLKDQHLMPGMYLLQLQTDTGNRIQKVIIE